jgi:hypothetical protein
VRSELVSLLIRSVVKLTDSDRESLLPCHNYDFIIRSIDCEFIGVAVTELG